MMRKLILAALFLTGITAMAQDHNRKEGRRQMQDLNPEQLATLQSKRMTLALDLTEGQQSKIKEMFAKNAEARKANMEEHKARKENGKTLTDDEKFALKNERLDQQIAYKKEMKSILNDEQYAKWERMNHRKGMHKKGKHRRGQEGKRTQEK